MKLGPNERSVSSSVHPLEDASKGVHYLVHSHRLYRPVGVRIPLGVEMPSTPVVAVDAPDPGVGFRQRECSRAGGLTVPRGQLMDEARALPRELVSKSPFVMKLAGDSFMRQNDFEYHRAIENAAETICTIIAAGDAQGGLNAFREKRRPR